MNENTISRRRFCQLAAGGLALAPSLASAASAFQQPTAGRLTAREVVRRIRREVGVPWRTPTADEFKVGDPDAPITGIKYIQDNKLVVWRFHDHWHARRPDGIFTGWNRVMGWDKYAVPGATPMSHEYAIPETRLEDLAKELQTKLKMTSLRIVGDPELKVTRVGSAGHYIGQCMALLPRLDAIMVFECREWEGAEYVRDAIASGQKKALLQMPHEGGEEMGMDECAQWLQTFVSEVPVKFIPSGDPFWLVA